MSVSVTKPEIFPAQVEQAVAILRRGGLVAFPTETVYGLGADASNPIAVERIFSVKGRPHDHPVIVHLSDIGQLEQWADSVSPTARLLAERFWPGPLTLIVRRAAGVGDAITAGQNTVGLRVPAHPLAQALLRAFGAGIAAPSANRFGRISPTAARHVDDDLGSEIDMILDGGSCEIGIESTIVDISTERPTLLRPGRITAAELAAVLGAPLAGEQVWSPRAPGMLATHYSPRTALRVLASRRLADTILQYRENGLRVAVLARRVPAAAVAHCIVAPPRAIAYARELYANLRRLDEAGCDIIIVEEPADEPAWAAVRDRLFRAARSPQ